MKRFSYKRGKAMAMLLGAGFNYHQPSHCFYNYAGGYTMTWYDADTMEVITVDQADARCKQLDMDKLKRMLR